MTLYFYVYQTEREGDIKRKEEKSIQTLKKHSGPLRSAVNEPVSVAC